MQNATNPVLQLERISKSYPGVVALDAVNLTVHRNEMVGLVGENGAGKSTLMKIMIGWIQPDSGSYQLRGERITLKNPAHATRHGVGMVFQEGSLVPNLSIMENLFLCHEIGFRKLGLLSQRAMRKTAASMLSMMKVSSDPDTPIRDTTPAVRQIVKIARLLWLSKLYEQENPILILDEPTTVLSERERNMSLVGLVGSGKEELCRCITGLEKPESGSITLCGKKLAPGSPRDRVRSGLGHVPIDRRSEGLALGMSVADNVNLLVLDRLKVAGLLNPNREKRNALRLIDDCRVKTPATSAMCSNLSGGNQQKVVIAKWLSSKSLAGAGPSDARRGCRSERRDLQADSETRERWDLNDHYV
jgi:ABC-type sugar transport system ATPase subunit